MARAPAQGREAGTRRVKATREKRDGRRRASKGRKRARRRRLGAETVARLKQIKGFANRAPTRSRQKGAIRKTCFAKEAFGGFSTTECGTSRRGVAGLAKQLNRTANEAATRKNRAVDFSSEAPASKIKGRNSVADVRHQRHEARAFDGGGDGVLADGGAAGLATADDFALTARQLFEEFDVFVVDEHRARTFAVDAQRIAFLAADLRLGTFAIDTILFECRRFRHVFLPTVCVFFRRGDVRKGATSAAFARNTV